MRLLLVLLALGAAPSLARAQRHYYRYDYDRNEISVGAGIQLDATGWEPAGMKLFFEYARRVGPHGAVVFQANPLVVPGIYDAPCHDRITPCAGGFSGNGYSFDLLFGGKWRWHARNAPLLGTFDLTFGAVPLFERLFDDNGVAVVGRAGGGLVVLLARHVGLRFDGHVLAGPAFLGYWRCSSCGDIRPYVAFDTGIMVEFIF
ncbi:MAG TPA: hypothetical protein VF945_11345 [Polyangia bacterium]